MSLKHVSNIDTNNNEGVHKFCLKNVRNSQIFHSTLIFAPAWALMANSAEENFTQAYASGIKQEPELKTCTEWSSIF